jgi:hypothetical protein
MIGVAASVLVGTFVYKFLSGNTKQVSSLFNAANGVADADMLVALIRDDWNHRVVDIAGVNPNTYPTWEQSWVPTNGYFTRGHDYFSTQNVPACNPANPVDITALNAQCGDLVIRRTRPNNAIGNTYYRTVCVAGLPVVWSQVATINTQLAYSTGTQKACSNNTRPFVQVIQWEDETLDPTETWNRDEGIATKGQLQNSSALYPAPTTASGMVACFKPLRHYNSGCVAPFSDAVEVELSTVVSGGGLSAAATVVQRNFVLSVDDKSAGLTVMDEKPLPH